MGVFGIAIMFLSFVIAYQAWQNGRFMKGEMKSTKSLLGGMKELLAKMDERSAKMDETSEQRHREIVELLKRGFGDLSRDVAGIKVADKE